jgi:hypothetical protein
VVCPVPVDFPEDCDSGHVRWQQAMQRFGQQFAALDNSMNARTLLTPIVLFAAMLQVTPANASKPYSDVVQMAPDTYTISRTDHGGIFGNAEKMRTKVIQEANDFAESKGKVAVMSHIHETPLVVGRSFATIEYTFWVLDKNDADAHRISVRQDANMRVQVDQRTTAPVTVQPAPVATKPDLYSELTKLDDLHKRGILTDTEFQEQKQRILASQ